MKFSKITLCGSVAFGLSMIVACGEQNTTEVTQVTGLSMIEAGESLPACNKENVGDMVFVADSAATYYCSEGKWLALNGKDGVDGANGAAQNGTGCIAKSVAEGVEISCGGTVVGTLKNGQSIQGENGHSCSVAQNETKTGSVITCETDSDPVSYEVKYGESGTGCKAEAIENGVRVICGSEILELKNGMTPYEIAVKNNETEDEETWFASLNASCTVSEVTDNGITGYKFVCGDNEKTVRNGDVGEDCAIAGDGNGKVTVKCGENTKEIYKGYCGANPFDPERKFCYDNELYDYCDDEVYNPTEEYCLALFNSQRVERWLIDPRDKKHYKTVTIVGVVDGKNYKRVWMAENLKYELKNTYCGGMSSDDDYTGDCETYGRLYNDFDVTDKTTPLCPAGWEVPSVDDWEKLLAVVDGEDNLKSVSGWEYRLEDAYGFEALPAGFVYGEDEERYNGDDEVALFWTSDGDKFVELDKKSDDETPLNGYFYDNEYYQDKAISVRCIESVK